MDFNSRIEGLSCVEGHFECNFCQALPLVQQEQEAQLPRAVHSEGGADGDEVLEALAHLQPVDVQVPRVDEVVDPLLDVVVRLRVVAQVAVESEVRKRFFIFWFQRYESMRGSTAKTRGQPAPPPPRTARAGSRGAGS